MLRFIFVLCLLLSFSLHAEKKVLAFAGSTREDSVNNKLVLEAADIAKKLGANVTVINLKDFPMPFYDADLEAKEKLPEKAKQFRQLMIQSDLIFIASPEYNSSLSGVLKNALDWASRNEEGEPSRDAFKGKLFLIMSASPGSIGGSRGLVHLKAVIENVGGKVYSEQISLSDAYNAFDEKGHLKNFEKKSELQKHIKDALNS